MPGLRVDAEQEMLRPVSLSVDPLLCQVLEEVDGGALVELLRWVLQYTEHDGLGWGADDGEEPGAQHHQPAGLLQLVVHSGLNWGVTWTPSPVLTAIQHMFNTDLSFYTLDQQNANAKLAAALLQH